jgi:hypothetical protein
VSGHRGGEETIPRYRKAPNGQWPGFPSLHLEDIETESIRDNRYIAEALVNNRKGHVVVLMNQELYEQFLAAVRQRKGDASASHVNEAVLDAVKDWIKKR